MRVSYGSLADLRSRMQVVPLNPQERTCSAAAPMSAKFPRFSVCEPTPIFYAPASFSLGGFFNVDLAKVSWLRDGNGEERPNRRAPWRQPGGGGTSGGPSGVHCGRDCPGCQDGEGRRHCYR